MSCLSVDVSIVSHGQADLVESLMRDLAEFAPTLGTIYLVKNVPEMTPRACSGLSNLVVIENTEIKGFGANHNQVAKRSNADVLIIVNPDIRLHSFDVNSFSTLLSQTDVCIAAPLVVSADGQLEDSLRKFPSVLDIVKKALKLSDGGVQSTPRDGVARVEWAAGMFLAIRLDQFRKLGGFDERYFLYYEDVDLCARVNLAGGKVMCMPSQVVVHNARRESHRKLKYLLWHLSSIIRYFSTYGLSGPRYRRDV